jgi:ankyrin repeat protein
MAANNGVALALNFYIQHGYTELEISDASPASSRGLRALHIAVKEGHDECVKILLASGAGVEFKTFLNKYTPFLFVVEPRYATPQKTTAAMLAIAKKLIAAKADIFVKDRNGRNALFGASRLGAIELMEFLVEKGLQLDIKDLSDNTLIHVTTEYDQKKTLEYLIKKGVDVCVLNNKGITPLHIAVSKYNCALVKILVGANANAVDINDKAGKTPFDEAVRLAAQYDGPEELRPMTTAIPQMSREKARQNIKDIVALFHNIRGTKDIAPIITTISRRATEPIIRGL